MPKRRIGILPGTFDPVHAGHITFALQAIQLARLDSVIFLPERRPRTKPGVEHFGHRTAMITRAIRPHINLGLLELPDAYFTIEKTYPKLQKEFAGAELVLLIGSDVVPTLSSWPKVQTLLKKCELVVSMRAGESKENIIQILQGLPAPVRYQLIESPTAAISSGKIRRALQHRLPVRGLLTSVARYAEANWLYASVSRE